MVETSTRPQNNSTPSTTSSSNIHSQYRITVAWLQSSFTGADLECIYKWRDGYAVSLSFYEPLGPFHSLSAAIRASELNLVTSATVSISSSELTAEQIAKSLKTSVDPLFALRINGETWFLSQNRKFLRETNQGVE